jgi:hypothetical protein
MAPTNANDVSIIAPSRRYFGACGFGVRARESYPRARMWGNIHRAAAKPPEERKTLPLWRA